MGVRQLYFGVFQKTLGVEILKNLKNSGKTCLKNNLFNYNTSF